MKAFCLLNHELTKEQETELRNDWGCDTIIYPPKYIVKCWANIPTEKRLNLEPLAMVNGWWEDNNIERNDICIIQGEVGSVCALVQFAQIMGYVPVHAVSKRTSVDTKNEDGTVTKQSVFKHECFRKYFHLSELSSPEKVYSKEENHFIYKWSKELLSGNR